VNRLFKKLVAILILNLVPFAFATAHATGDETVASAQTVIERQIQAFLQDDALTAYSFAAPSIQSQYPDPARFFDMVKRGYAPVYRPSSYSFGRGKSAPDGSTVIQEVLISDEEGQDWTAVYVLERQVDGSFKITGVRMRKSASQQI